MSALSAREHFEPLSDQRDVEMVKAAQRCIMASLDHSRAETVTLACEGQRGPTIELPPIALRAIVHLLGLMAEQKPIVLIPQGHEVTTQEAAAFLNVSRPFVIQEIKNGRLACRLVGSHRRIAYADLLEYQRRSHETREAALQALASEAQELGLGYN